MEIKFDLNLQHKKGNELGNLGGEMLPATEI